VLPLTLALLAQMTPLATADAIEAGLASGKPSRAVVLGTLERVTMGKGRKTWLGTALVLDDDEVVWLSYGAPPAGFEPFLGQFVRVEGVLSKTKSTQEQSLIAPHLLSPAKPVREPRALESLVGRRVRLVGTAANAKGGAVVLVQGTPVFVSGMAAWPSGVETKRVALGGTLTATTIPAPPVGPKGEVSAGASGEQLILERPSEPSAF
jgi:hypothetical protein